MRQPCISPDDLGRVLGLPSDSPERLHLEACPRCRALLLTYREFLEERSVPPGADPERAGGRLRAAFRAAAGSPDAPPSPSWAPSAAPRWYRLREFGRQLRRPLVVGPAAAVLLIAIGLYAGSDRLRRESGPDSLRGAETSRGGDLAPVPLLGVTSREPGGVVVAWRAVPDATSYEVVVMGDNLADLARISVPGDTSCVIRGADLRPSPPSGALLGWQVFAFRDAAPVARSPIETLRIP